MPRLLTKRLLKHWATLLLVSSSIFTVAAEPSSRTVSHLALSLGQNVDRWTRRSQNIHQKDAIAVELTSSRRTTRGGSSIAVGTIKAWQRDFLNLGSGGLAGFVASTITNPLDVIKTQLQSSENAKRVITDANGAVIRAGGERHALGLAKQILREDGIAGFWRGLPLSLVGIIPSRSVYFSAYEAMKSFLDRSSIPNFEIGKPLNSLVSGFAAGIAGNTITNPIWMVRTRMQLHADPTLGQQAYSNWANAIKTIYKEEGIGGFYKGISASYWGCAEGACQFLLYEDFQHRLLKRINTKRAKQGLRPITRLSKIHYFWTAAASKMLATIATYPHEVARTRMREQAIEGIFRYRGMWQTLALIAKEEGARSMYAGMGVHLMKVVPNSAFMFLTYEIVKGWLGELEVVG